LNPFHNLGIINDRRTGTIFVYDIAGNVVNDGNGNQPTYDAESTMATDAGVTYSYDADGVRTGKSSGTMYWPGARGEVLAETDLSGNINEEYIYFNGARIARVDRPSGTVHYYFSDHLGSASVITDASGNVEEGYYYYPYGVIQSTTGGGDPNHYRFTGKERDTESNLDNFGARYYTSSMGRFTTPDWAARPTAVPYAVFGDPQSLNLYGYVRDDPVSRADADGHCPASKSAIACEVGWDSYDFGPEANAPDNGAQGQNRSAQNTSSKGGGFWHRLGQHFGNLFSGHSWNFGMRESVTTRIVTEVREPNPYVAIGTDALGLVGEATHHASLGRLGAAISIVNDPSATNVAMTGAAFIPVVGEGVGAVAAVQDVATPAAQAFVDHVMTPMFNAAPPQNIEDGNGHLIPNPALMDECQAMGGCH
jgi:RHS repeat-associated protein